MDLRQIPARPNVEQYEKQAKDLLRLLRSSDDRAWLRLKENHPLASTRPSGGEVSLADAQLVVAREHGFESWPKYGGTALGTAVWASAHRSPMAEVDYAPIVAQLLEAGADAKAAGGPSGNPQIDEMLSRHGAVSG